MFALLHSLAIFVIDFFKSPRRLKAENLFLRHQLSIALRRAPPRLRLRGSDRALMMWLTRRWPSLLGCLSSSFSSSFVVLVVLVVLVLLVVLIVGVSRRRRVAHDGDEAPVDKPSGNVLE